MTALAQGPRNAWREWERRGASPTVVRWLRYGVCPSFLAEPAPFDFGDLQISDPSEQLGCEELLQRYLRTGAIRKSSKTAYVSKCFVIPKRSGGLRLIIDLRPLNRYCTQQPFKYHTLHTLQHALQPSDWMASFDLQDGYHHVDIAASSQHYFCFGVNGQYYTCCGLPFGWSQSPAVFTKVMLAFVHMTRRPQPVTVRSGQHSVTLRMPAGVRVRPYLDDFLVMAHSKEAADLAGKYLQALLGQLGLQWHPSKSHWQPTQRIEHLGLLVDSSAGRFEVTDQRVSEIRSLAKNLLATANKNRRWLPVRALAALTGKVASVLLAVPSARFFTRSFHTDIATRSSWHSKVRLSRQSLRDLLWWRRLPARFNGGRIWTPVSHSTLVTDASDAGWAGVCDGSLQAHGFWSSAEREEPIAVRELLALKHSVAAFAEHLEGKVVRALTDSIATRSSASKLTSSSGGMMRVVRALWWLLDAQKIQLLPEYVPGPENAADALSRWMDSSDWQLHPKVFQQLERLYGPHTVDRFASHTTAQLRRYNTLFYDPAGSGVDAFAQLNWQRENNYCNPPWQLLSKLTSLLGSFPHVQATVLAPYWQSAPWFDQLLEICNEYFVLPVGSKLFHHSTSPNSVSLRSRWPVIVCRIHR